jgi:hypothetical protein
MYTSYTIGEKVMANLRTILSNAPWAKKAQSSTFDVDALIRQMHDTLEELRKNKDNELTQQIFKKLRHGLYDLHEKTLGIRGQQAEEPGIEEPSPSMHDSLSPRFSPV